jgi:hypothetical protein
MNANPSVNVVVFEVQLGDRLEKLVAEGPTRSADCVKRAWSIVGEMNGVLAKDVRRVYSEWQPSAEDLAFLEANFPQAAVTYSFKRPRADQWDQAMAQAGRTIEQAVGQGAALGSRPAKKWWQFWK